MTHSLHRTGTCASLKNDYVILITPAVGVNHYDSKEKLVKPIPIFFWISTLFFALKLAVNKQ